MRIMMILRWGASGQPGNGTSIEANMQMGWPESRLVPHGRGGLY